MSTRDRALTAGLLILTISTGIVDAVSYLGLDRVFTGNMTGNVLFLGFALVGVGGIPFVNNLVALLGFVLGSIVGGRIVGRGHPVGLPRRSFWLLVGGGALMLALSAVWLVARGLPEPVLYVVTLLLAMVMGAQVSAVKPVGNSDITTIVVTNTLANLARESRLGGGHDSPWLTRLLAVLAMGVGAVIGAAVLRYLGGPATLVAGALVYAAAVVTLRVGHAIRG